MLEIKLKQHLSGLVTLECCINIQKYALRCIKFHFYPSLYK